LSAALAAFDSDQLVVHTLRGGEANPPAGLPALGYVSPLASRGYPTLETTAGATAGLESPDAILGAAKIGGGVAVIYVEKQLNASTTNNCSSTPRWALTNIDTGHPRNANKDVVTIRVATTTDGINFSDVGPVSELQDPITTVFNGIRWLGSGSIIALANGRYGKFFAAGDCLDNDCDGFNAGTGGALGAARWPQHEFFSGRVYDPQGIVTDRSRVTIVFAGYNTPQPSSNLGDCRAIARFQLRFPDDYVARPPHLDAD